MEKWIIIERGYPKQVTEEIFGSYHAANKWIKRKFYDLIEAGHDPEVDAIRIDENRPMHIEI